MASGIVAGVRKINELDSSLEKIIITVCDQPFVIASIFEQLDQAQLKSGKNIIASKYSNTKGTPVLFTRKYFSHLLKLQGDHGAKKILEVNQEDVAAIDFPKGNIDIDTEKDYKELLGE
jgi:molybdenum cofactor cytidylyltransferase